MHRHPLDCRWKRGKPGGHRVLPFSTPGNRVASFLARREPKAGVGIKIIGSDHGLNYRHFVDRFERTQGAFEQRLPPQCDKRLGESMPQAFAAPRCQNQYRQRHDTRS